MIVDLVGRYMETVLLIKLVSTRLVSIAFKLKNQADKYQKLFLLFFGKLYNGGEFSF